MHLTRKLDRAVQWAGERMGAEAKATQTDEFTSLQAEMELRHEGVERLQKSMNVYTRWVGRRCDALEDRNRSAPMSVLGRTMVAHSEDFTPESEFGQCLQSFGSANEHIAELQNSYLDCATATWTQHLERNAIMMKEYQGSRKKLENRRLAYDATMGKIQKAKRDDVRLEEELRINKEKFDDSTEDVFRRMQDIKEAESDSVDALTSFLDAELDYHERAAERLRRVRQSLARSGIARPTSQDAHDHTLHRTRSDATWQSPRRSTITEGYQSHAVPSYQAVQTARLRPAAPPPPPMSRPSVPRAATFEPRRAPSVNVRGTIGTLSRSATESVVSSGRGDDVFADDTSTCSGGISPGWGHRSVSPATSFGSIHGGSNVPETKRAPPPPVNRAKKPPPPPVPAKRF